MATDWACGVCGTVNKGNTTGRCLGCGDNVALPPLALVCPTTGAVLKTGQQLQVGQALLKRYGFGGEAAYASEPQFELVPDRENQVWRVFPVASARNATCYNGARLAPSGAVLAAGGVIELGPGKLRLRVELEKA